MPEFLTTGGFSFELVVWGIYFGIVIASFLSTYHKRHLGSFIRALIENEAFTPDDAMTLEELGMANKSLIKSAIRGGNVYKSLVYESRDEVYMVEDRAIPVYHDSIDFCTARFYIPYELRIRAEMKFDKKGSHIMLSVIAAAVFFVIAMLLTLFADEIMTWVSSQFIIE